jgi:hypothetical protein
MNVRPGRCTRCTLEDVALVAGAVNGRVEIAIKKPGEPSNGGDIEVDERGGYEVFIRYPDGEASWAAWLEGLHERCQCRGRR